MHCALLSTADQCIVLSFAHMDWSQASDVVIPEDAAAAAAEASPPDAAAAADAAEPE